MSEIQFSLVYVALLTLAAIGMSVLLLIVDGDDDEREEYR